MGLHFSGIFQAKTLGSREQRLGAAQGETEEETAQAVAPRPPNSTDQGWVPRRPLGLGPGLSGSGEQEAGPADLTEFGWRKCPQAPSTLGQSLPLIFSADPRKWEWLPGTRSGCGL